MNKRNTYKIKTALSSAIMFALGLLLMTSCDLDTTQTVAKLSTLVMQDEFDTNGAPNPEYWNIDEGTGPNNDGWGNGELQHYTNRTSNLTVQNGYLLITAQKEDYQGSAYTSAKIQTKTKVEHTYGRFEARIRVPYGQGMWPAFWLLGNDIDEVTWPQCGEIDIMEYTGDKPTILHGSVHGPGYSGGNPVTKTYELMSDRFDTGFHIFGIEWGPDYINYYVDDVLYNQITPDDAEGEWVFDHPFYIIINLAVGGTFPGPPSEETVFPQTMLVDYIRVYK